jgi:hypothetical protein
MMVSRFEDSGILQIYENFGTSSWNISRGVWVLPCLSSLLFAFVSAFA